MFRFAIPRGQCPPAPFNHLLGPIIDALQITFVTMNPYSELFLRCSKWLISMGQDIPLTRVAAEAAEPPPDYLRTLALS